MFSGELAYITYLSEFRVQLSGYASRVIDNIVESVVATVEGLHRVSRVGVGAGGAAHCRDQRQAGKRHTPDASLQGKENC